MPLAFNVDRFAFGVLAENAGVSRVPTVTAFSHHPIDVDNVAQEVMAAQEWCREQNLIDRAGKVSDDVANLLSLYGRASEEFDLRFSVEQQHERRATVSRSGRDAVRTVVDGDLIYVEEVSAHSAIASLVAVLPEQAPARIKATGFDLAAVQGITDDQHAEAQLRSHGVDTREFRKVTQLLDEPRLGAGQIGVTIWGRGHREQRAKQTVEVIDVTSGRIALYNSNGQRMIVGADAATFDRVLGGILTDTRRCTRQ